MQQIQHQQQQHHLGHHPQQLPPQQQNHQGYHQVQAHHPNMPPVSLSASPHPQQQPQPHLNHQAPMPGPPPQQHHLNSQSPHHHVGPPMHLQQQPPPHHPAQQQPNHMVRQPLGPPVMNQTQSGAHHHQNFFSGGSIPQSSVHHYPQNQSHPHHQQSPQHLHNHHHQQPSPIIHPGPPMVSHQPHMQAGVGRNSPFYAALLQTELRIIELNRRLQCRPISRNPSPLPSSPIDESLWWERFATEFFEDDASLTIRVQDDKPVDYTIGRTLIPRFFRSHFDGGVSDLSISLRNAKEVSLQPQTLTLECDQAFIITTNVLKDPVTATNQTVVVHTEGHLLIEFVSNNFDTLSIKSWRFITRGYREFIDRSMLATMGLHNSSLVKPITIQGLTKSTNAYLKMCMIMEPIQDLMVQHKRTNMDPRTCLRKLLLEKYNFKSEGDNRATKRRKRKPAANPSVASAGNTKKSKASVNNSINNSNINNTMLISTSGPPNFSLASQDVMVVGEPSMLGADFGDENERRITRLENSQFDAPMNGSNDTNSNGINGTSNSGSVTPVTSSSLE